MTHLTAWERINGSPNRIWRYMTSIGPQPITHWWEYNHRDAFIIVKHVPGGYQADVYHNARVVNRYAARSLRQVQTESLAYARGLHLNDLLSTVPD